MIERHPAMYAVVGSKPCLTGYCFSVWHDTLEEAKAEALRLSEKENLRFVVLKVVGCADRKPIPVEWTDF